MSFEGKEMASPNPCSNPRTHDVSTCNRAISVNSNIEPPQAPRLQNNDSGPVSILWDIENCPVPSDVRPEDVAGNIRMALRVHPVINGVVTMFSAYGDFNAFPRRLREGCQRTGVKLVDVPNGRKDAADKAILVDMFLFALDNQPPSSILLISGDVDFSPALHILGQRGYTIILVIPAGVGVSSALSNAGRFVWDWPSVARGEGFVPPKSYVPRMPDLASYLMSSNIEDNCDNQNEEEAIVYQGTSQSDYSCRSNANQVYCYNSSHVSREHSRASHTVTEFRSTNLMSMPFMASSSSLRVPSAGNENPLPDQNGSQDLSWVQPGDLRGLKGQMIRLLETSGGSLPLVRIPAEYLKIFGRPLYMAEYGVYKLVHLINKMGDSFVVAGKGHKKMVCLRNYDDRQIKKCPSTPASMRKDKKGKGISEDNMESSICPNMGSSSDECSDDAVSGLDNRNMDAVSSAAYESDERLESFRLEVQELLVCYSCPVPLSSFISLYEQRYKKPLYYQNFRVDGLEQLIEKVRDVVDLREDSTSKKKFLVST